MLPSCLTRNGGRCSFRNGVKGNTHFSIRLREDPLHIILQTESYNHSINRLRKPFLRWSNHRSSKGVRLRSDTWRGSGFVSILGPRMLCPSGVGAGAGTPVLRDPQRLIVQTTN